MLTVPCVFRVLEAFGKDPRLAFPQYAEPPRLLYGGDLSRPVNLDAANSIILRNPYLLAVSSVSEIVVFGHCYRTYPAIS